MKNKIILSFLCCMSACFGMDEPPNRSEIDVVNEVVRIEIYWMSGNLIKIAELPSHHTYQQFCKAVFPESFLVGHICPNIESYVCRGNTLSEAEWQSLPDGEVVQAIRNADYPDRVVMHATETDNRLLLVMSDFSSIDQNKRPTLFNLGFTQLHELGIRLVRVEVESFVVPS